ncbi:bifunctional [glutamate--ammonia ligase]-adenylyl-L-tyrosine phosphorylase/[glutamate--ammonia-ligase] adenylyltransferase [Thiomicrorhabdus sp. ZW0627]|uniref:bifunctional [glutamate--ammonia ligase]-adenylyl-L-tyrosine phosphorylase/[glutamate--ammonia-ligase] adenylyltransferase n=1 Tax=Thiomicrorhabdus sp. ZW0627 TaxID=3039774 RepID=UPI00243663CF|nr:bifunctional [glutamate--ammonia ligase]-adenylyl-L-tyrosine phosphorylase/[glutamate--ammonia-ligase] adenylyltransferase [Thiomicrorhabdus sp. ZW0627]MDG6773542.1 bifunctional [glutamate--ammonia ligase]-adenylyl-L-tyrosine phosphorylase/[glutamate--ammonia-ligase] adenylyltransferase [Thiomicrorhabdus sp. ZW0627]
MEYSLQNAIDWSRFVEMVGRRYPEVLEESHWRPDMADGELYRQVYGLVRGSEDETVLKRHLRQQRNWQMTRIAIRDLTGLADLQETMRDVSDLADALVAAALDWHYERFCERYGTPIGAESGKPQKLIVLGMGKLGGQELNFSSDIDLIFVYPEQGETQGTGKSISNDQFFVRLGQALNKSLVEVTEDGFVYRVDMRLRPFGDAGPLASSFAGIEHYYEIHGRAWERYALVKARAMAGDAKEAQSLFDILRPFVYRRYVDFSAMESLRELKQMISAEVKKKGMQDNVKLGPGGIREIEFIVQAFQLVHGGRDRTLQGRALTPMMQQLLSLGFIEQEVYDGLMAAYTFLRRAENRLQEWMDQQTHDLPRDAQQQLALASSMGFEDYAGFMSVLNKHRDYVQAQFVEVFATEEASEEVGELSDFWLGDMSSIEGLHDIELAEADIPSFLKHLNDFKLSRSVGRLSRDGVERLNAFMPLLIEALLKHGYLEQTFVRVLKVVESVVQRSVYLVLLKENPVALKHLISLCEISPWMTDMLAKYPALMDQLLDERALYAPLDLQQLNLEVEHLLEEVGEDEERFMEQIRQWRHAQVFRVAAADVTGNVPIMKVSDYLTWIAEAVLNGVVTFAWRYMQSKNGLPGGLDDESDRDPFLVLGYGKVGGIELGYGSDLDIVMLYEGLSPSASAVNERGRSLENSLYFVRMGQKVISLMTTLMPAGVLYEVDTRLRPNGASGLMVTDLSAYKSYIENKAWNWEHQAFVRARPVVGDVQSRSAFNEFRHAFLQKQRDPLRVRDEVIEMRQKMRESLDKSNDEVFDLKHGRGGIVDIEFMVQYLVLAFSHDYPELSEYTDNIRMLEAIERVGLLSVEDVESLVKSYKVYRSKYHRLALQNQKALVESDCYLSEREGVMSIWKKLMET